MMKIEQQRLNLRDKIVFCKEFCHSTYRGGSGNKETLQVELLDKHLRDCYEQHQELQKSNGRCRNNWERLEGSWSKSFLFSRGQRLIGNFQQSQILQRKAWTPLNKGLRGLTKYFTNMFWFPPMKSEYSWNMSPWLTTAIYSCGL